MVVSELTSGNLPGNLGLYTSPAPRSASHTGQTQWYRDTRHLTKNCQGALTGVSHVGPRDNKLGMKKERNMDIQGLRRQKFPPKHKLSSGKNKRTLNLRTKLTKQLETTTTLFLIVKLDRRKPLRLYVSIQRKPHKEDCDKWKRMVWMMWR